MSRAKRVLEWLMFKRQRDRLPTREEDEGIDDATLHDAVCLSCGMRLLRFPLSRLPARCPSCGRYMADSTSQ